ncbi:Mini-ribonuclease 3 [Jeotgalicoccus sp. WY2]|uniref:Mini-ribonuclease 3 n=1 Tax=Jeotgalicoccus sp. WY2 TaxID=2708346 RepID=UPI001BD31A12|nr:ribonuclease III domain-containing protein [Jeotgalicoccus sp. WY2]
MDNFKLDTVPSLSLAFLGDAVYAVHVREHLIRNKPYLKPDVLHREANKLVSARAQAEALHFLRKSELLTEEWDIAKKARNKSSATRAKNASIKEYRDASGLEALVGHLSLTENETRITELMAHIIENGSEA